MNDAKPSKSEKKRQHLALQELGEQLIALSEQQLHSIEVDEFLLDAIVAAKQMSSHGALRRQKQLIGKLMRHVDPLPISEALERFNSHGHLEKRAFANSENWRDRIAKEGRPALLEFQQASGRESEHLAQLLISHESAPTSDMRRHIRRQMFREIHQILTEEMQNAPS